MATADQVKELIRSYADGDDSRFYPIAMLEEITGAAVVTFRVPVAGAESRAESLGDRILAALRVGEQSKSGLATKLCLSSVTGQLNRAVAALLERSLIELTIPDKPNSRLQKYRLTAAGRAAVARSMGA